MTDREDFGYGRDKNGRPITTAEWQQRACAQAQASLGVDHYGYTIKPDVDIDAVALLLRDSPTDTLLSLHERLPAELEKRRLVASREEARLLSALYPPPKDAPVAPEKVIGNPAWMLPHVKPEDVPADHRPSVAAQDAWARALTKDKPVAPEEVTGDGSPSAACGCSSCRYAQAK